MELKWKCKMFRSIRWRAKVNMMLSHIYKSMNKIHQEINNKWKLFNFNASSLSLVFLFCFRILCTISDCIANILSNANSIQFFHSFYTLSLSLSHSVYIFLCLSVAPFLVVLLCSKTVNYVDMKIKSNPKWNQPTRAKRYINR